MTNWIVVLAYESCHLTRDCIDSLLAQDIKGGVSVLAINNGSSDNTLQVLAGYDSRVRVVSFPKNIGVSKAWNYGLRTLFGKEQAPYVFVVNNDTRHRPDAYRLLVADGGLFVTCVGTSSGAQFPGGPPKCSRRDHPDFSAFLIRRTCWDQVGPFDERFFSWCNDGSYHLRMHKQGIRAVCLDVPFFHVASGTIKNADERERTLLMALADRDRSVFRDIWGCEMGSPEYYSMFSPPLPPHEVSCGTNGIAKPSC